jgi:4,5-DOPA dioxygenase extradiol
MSMPTVFVSHGSPMLFLEKDLPARAFLSTLGSLLPRPEAIVAVSAHWNTEQPAVSLATRPETIHDFYGFPDALYRLHYDAPGAPSLPNASPSSPAPGATPATVSTTAPGCRRCWAGPRPTSRSSSSRCSPT